MRLFDTLMSALLVGGAALFIVKFLSIAVQTVDYPFHLEWMEGGMVETVDRLTSGLSIYGPPTIDYVPYIYSPFYFVVSGAFSAVMGVDFFALRLVSLLSILGVAMLFFRFVAREARAAGADRFTELKWAIASVGLLFATFHISGRWFHLARVDSLFMLLGTGALYMLRFHVVGAGPDADDATRRKKKRLAIGCGVLMWLAFLTKQSAPIALAPAGLAFLLIDWRRALWVGGAFVVATSASVLVLQWLTDGWFLYYIWDVPRMHPNVSSVYLEFWTVDMAQLGVAFAATFIALGFVAARSPRWGLFYLAVFVGYVLSAYLSRLHSGGWFNVLIPAYSAVALLLPLGFGVLEGQRGGEERRRIGGSPTGIGLTALLLVQLALLTYNSNVSLPADNAQDRGDAFNTYLAGVDGDVLIPDHRWVQTSADKRSFGLGMAARDVLRVSDRKDPGRLALTAELEHAIGQKRFAEVILSEKTTAGPWVRFLRRHYRFDRVIDAAPWPVTGWTIKPQWVWVPK